MQDEHLPSHRKLFAALLPPSPLPAAASEVPGTAAPEAIADRASSAQHSHQRRQLLTLHVIFPNLLLPALDLLDRGLVSRFVVADGEKKTAEAEASHAGVEAETAAPTNQDSTSRVSEGEQEVVDLADQICMYTVQSAASTTSRGRKRHAPLRTRTYAVHLDAWNCSCGGFALDAYSKYDAMTRHEQPSQSSMLSLRLGHLELAPPDDFPCCKHLLACLLAEKWRTSTDHARDQLTTKEELAAMIGGH